MLQRQKADDAMSNEIIGLLLSLIGLLELTRSEEFAKYFRSRQYGRGQADRRLIWHYQLSLPDAPLSLSLSLCLCPVTIATREDRRRWRGFRRLSMTTKKKNCPRRTNKLFGRCQTFDWFSGSYCAKLVGPVRCVIETPHWLVACSESLNGRVL